MPADGLLVVVAFSIGRSGPEAGLGWVGAGPVVDMLSLFSASLGGGAGTKLSLALSLSGSTPAPTVLSAPVEAEAAAAPVSELALVTLGLGSAPGLIEGFTAPVLTSTLDFVASASALVPVLAPELASVGALGTSVFDCSSE